MLALAQIAIFVSLLAMRFRWAVGAFVFFLAFSPRSLGVNLGGENVSLTFVRVAFPILIVAVVVGLLTRTDTTPRRPMAAFSEPTFVIVLALAVVKLFSSVVAGINPLYALNDALLSAGVFVIFFILAANRQMAGIFDAFLISAAVTILIVAIEYPLQSPLHFQFANRAILFQDLPEARFRGGAYRAQGIFDNPLGLAEFCIYALPVVLAFFVRAGWRTLWFGSFLVIGLIGVVLATGARSGILVGTITALVFIVAYHWHRFSLASRLLMSLVIAAAAFFAIIAAFNIVLWFAGEAEGLRLFTVEDEELRSTYSRALQFVEVYNTILDHPFFGHGVYQNFARELEAVRRIDNYYLRVGLEAGFVGIALFVAMLIATAVRVDRLIPRPDTNFDRALKAMLLSLIVGFALMKLFLSMPTNNIYFFLLMGTALGDLVRRGSETAYAPRTHAAKAPQPDAGPIATNET